MIKEYKPFVHVEVKERILQKQGISSNDVEDYLTSINYKEVMRVNSERVYSYR